MMALWPRKPSARRNGNCHDNAGMEAFWRSLKNEFVPHANFTTRVEARTASFDYLECFFL